mmetsp:Transcript_24329/g.27040  ORF Transcript_24329/g.27040 Transcript_24329/m.27040 type:complete len:293 (-) Transcript_24329:304-1182(-)
MASGTVFVEDSRVLLQHTPAWLSNNLEFFAPPVCNKLMHGEGQLKVMYVGGPNQRKDYHIEEGEEYFYQVKGDMVLKVIEKGKPKDIIIKEGECFTLPARIPHSPQRFEDTIGLVIERERTSNETDCLRWYTDDFSQVLYEEWFHCNDLGAELPPVINRYMASKQHKTGKPTPGTITDKPPFKVDVTTSLPEAMSLKKWISDRKDELSKGSALLADGEFKIKICGNDKSRRVQKYERSGETWLYQISGLSVVQVGNGPVIELQEGDSYLVPCNTEYMHKARGRNYYEDLKFR